MARASGRESQPRLEWLNYHHLLYFYMVAREGSVRGACERLLLAQPTISTQIRMLERAIGDRLFEKRGRGLVMSETGRVVYRYAEEIFALGRDLQDALKGRPTGRPLRLVVGVSDVIPKLVAYELLNAPLALPQPIHMICREDKPGPLLAQLAVYELDLVLADAPVGAAANVRAHSHLLGDCGVVFCGAAPLARRLRRGFPISLESAPVLLPSATTALRRALDQWFTSLGITPHVVGEFDDSALMKCFGGAGVGVFPVPDAIVPAVRRQYNVAVLGRAGSVREQYYAITVDRKLKHPGVVAISNAARTLLMH